MNVKLEKSETLEKRKAEQFVDKRELPMNRAKGRQDWKKTTRNARFSFRMRQD